ncbi:MAG: DUF1345 domain-containing protein [Actinomycetaceae bacterium]
MFCVLFAVTHIVMAHRVFPRMQPADLRRAALSQRRHRGPWWRSLFGEVSAETWTVQGALMAYAYVTRYGHLDVEHGALGLDLPAAPRYRDYLTMSVLTSTMTGSGVRCRTSEAWSAMRTHSILAFAFNTVIVAMTISLLVGGLGT